MYIRGIVFEEMGIVSLGIFFEKRFGVGKFRVFKKI